MARSECAACNEHFVSVESFDAHRVGKHGVLEGSTRRRCLTVAEMSVAEWDSSEKGWRHPKGMRRNAQKAQRRGEQAA